MLWPGLAVKVGLLISRSAVGLTGLISERAVSELSDKDMIPLRIEEEDCECLRNAVVLIPL